MAKRQPKKKPQPKEYNREFIVQSLLETAQEEKGIAKINALKEIRSMLSEEQPDKELDIDISFVPIVYDGEKFKADKSKAVKI